MAPEILALIVVYGESPLQTASFHTLAAAAGTNVRVLIWDNSPLAQPPKAIEPAWADRLTYVSTPENLGLSTIYNRVIASHLRENEFLLILDQDSHLPPDFFARAAEAIAAHPDIDLFLPMVRAHERWVSPLTFFCGWGRYWPAPRRGLQPAARCAAINSGMLVSARYLKGDYPGYDERLRFYGTDTQFMVVYATQRRWFCVVDAVIPHDLSFFSSSVSKKCGKFLEIKSAYRWVYEGHPWYWRLAVAGVMGVVSIRYALKFRSLAFLSRG